MMDWVTIIKVSERIEYNSENIKQYSKYIGHTYEVLSKHKGGGFYVIRGKDSGEYKVYFDEVRPATKREIKKFQMELIAGRI